MVCVPFVGDGARVVLVCFLAWRVVGGGSRAAGRLLGILVRPCDQVSPPPVTLPLCNDVVI